jgi:hypothetical protein
MAVRMPTEQAEVLEKVAEVDGVSGTEAIRGAIEEEHISARAAAVDFKARLVVSMESNQRILDRRSKA